MATSVPRLFPRSTIVCLGGGPSLTLQDVEACHGRGPVIAISDAHRLAPWADVLYSCDAKWWGHYSGVSEFAGLKFALEKRADRWPGVQVLENTGSRGLELAPTGLRTGSNSGMQAINLAVHLGARRIVLLGYDLQPAADGRTHWFGRHPFALRRESPYGIFLDAFGTLVLPLHQIGVEVVNASRVTALTAFPRCSLEAALEGKTVAA